MQLLFFCPLWGSENLAFEQFCKQVKTAGFDGVELSFALGDKVARDERLRILADFELKHIAQHWQTINANLDEHRAEFVAHLDFLASTNPLFINSQSGRDWFSKEENLWLLDQASERASVHGLKIVHETHRGKFSFSARSTYEVLQSRPDLRLTADFSHWCCVSESLLEDQELFVQAAIERADHLHARVGFAEGPQIVDPRAPEWLGTVNAHLVWWDQIVAQHLAKGSQLLTVCPEFGPWPYMVHQAWTQEPVASQWECNLHMLNMLRSRWQI